MGTQSNLAYENQMADDELLDDLDLLDDPTD